MYKLFNYKLSSFNEEELELKHQLILSEDEKMLVKMIFKKINTPGASGYLKENVTKEKI